MLMFVFLAIALLALSYVLSRSTDILVAGINQLGEGTAVESYGLTAFLVALATSLPELFVGVSAALQGEPLLPIGVVLGSNIANVSIVIGGAAMVGGVVKAKDHIYRKELVYAFLIGALPLLLMIDGRLSRIDGVVLLVVYVFYVMETMAKKKTKRRLERAGDEYYKGSGLGHRILVLVGRKDVEQGLLRLIVGSALLIVVSDLVVRLSVQMAHMINIPVILIGLFMVSIGTSLPELTFEIKTVGRKEYLMAFGNIIGSTVTNSSLILGLVAFLNPVVLGETVSAYFVSVAAFVLLYGLFWYFVYSSKRLERWEGLALVLFYLVFVVVQMRMF